MLVTIGFSLYLYVQKEKNLEKEFIDKNNSPIQLISQIKGYFHNNSFIALSFAITIFSFVGIPPAIGFFAKQMILSAALDSGYVFMAFVAIITSVIGAGYYLNLVKEIFFYPDNYQNNPSTDNSSFTGYICSIDNNENENKSDNLEPKGSTTFLPENITINSSLSASISVLTLLLILFIFISEI